MPTWQKTTFNNHVDLLAGFAFRSKFFTDSPDDIHLVKGADVQQGYINWGGCRRWPKTKTKKLEKFWLEKDDVILAMDRPWISSGLKWGWIKTGDPESLLVQRVARLRGKRGLLTQYLRYLIASPQFTDYVRPIVTGVNVPHISGNQILSFSFLLPPLPTQKKIASILSAYDDLIENNLKRIKILEEMAQNLYREWFVKFRFPGHQNTRFVDSSLGRIPAGWEVARLDSLIANHIGGGWGKEAEDGKHTESAWVIRGTDIPNARFCDFSKTPFRYHSISNLKTRRLLPGDIVFEVSGGSKDQPLGRSLLISSELLRCFNDNDVICASFCKRIQPDSSKYASELLYLSFLDAYDSGEIKQYQVQSTGISNFKWSAYIEKVKRCVPPTSLQNRFRQICAPVFSEISTLGRKNTTLRRTRDLLLPKLISGEVDVSELDIKIPEKEEV